MFRRRTAGLAAAFVVGLLIFSQVALAVAACDWTRRSPAQAVSLADEPPCHAPAQLNVNLCLADCLSADQDVPSGAAPAALPAADRVLGIVELRAHSGSRARPAEPPPPEPPPRIRYRILRI